jgi:NCS1 family nucleobase:cation symporter-1
VGDEITDISVAYSDSENDKYDEEAVTGGKGAEAKIGGAEAHSKF